MPGKSHEFCLHAYLLSWEEGQFFKTIEQKMSTTINNCKGGVTSEEWEAVGEWIHFSWGSKREFSGADSFPLEALILEDFSNLAVSRNKKRMEREVARAREGRLGCCTFLWHVDELSPRNNGQEQRFTLDRWYFRQSLSVIGTSTVQ